MIEHERLTMAQADRLEAFVLGQTTGHEIKTFVEPYKEQRVIQGRASQKVIAALQGLARGDDIDQVLDMLGAASTEEP